MDALEHLRRARTASRNIHRECPDEFKTAEHKSHDQTRRMIIESIIADAMSHIDAAIVKLDILDRQLY